MLIENPVYETWEEIERKYDGYCVFMANCIGNITLPEGGEVWGYNKSLADLTGEVMHFIESDTHNLGMYTFITLTDFGYTGGVLQVVTVDD
ncbi:MAG: hypothetical protein FWC89_05030 [Defluviitaleaceae bacterium]|nr:hypothetical protein [Defluviitaleaceae bacterium]